MRDMVAAGRAPHGARGLKSTDEGWGTQENPSRPARGAWIEMPGSGQPYPDGPVAPRTGRVD